MRLPEQILSTDIRASDGVYGIVINEVPLLTPKGHPVTMLSWELANAMADELMAAGEIDLHRVTLYGLYATQRDFVEDRVEGTIAAILQHLPGDFVLHPDATPALSARQLTAWAPLLTFLRALGPEVPIAQPLHEPQIPWELTEALRIQLSAMHVAQVTVVLQAVTNLGSVALGMLLARQAIMPEEAVAALTVTADYAARGAGGADAEPRDFAAEMRRSVRCLLQYAKLGSAPLSA